MNKAKELNKGEVYPVHIIEDGYCHACLGACQYYKVQGKDVPEGLVFIVDDILTNEEITFENIPTDILEKVAKGEFVCVRGEDVGENK